MHTNAGVCHGVRGWVDARGGGGVSCGGRRAGGAARTVTPSAAAARAMTAVFKLAWIGGRFFAVGRKGSTQYTVPPRWLARWRPGRRRRRARAGSQTRRSEWWSAWLVTVLCCVREAGECAACCCCVRAACRARVSCEVRSMCVMPFHPYFTLSSSPAAFLLGALSDERRVTRRRIPGTGGVGGNT